MIYIREGSHTHTLLLLLAFVGEYPAKSLHLLGKERTWKALVQKLTRTQEYCLSDTGKRFRCKLLTVSGKGKQKTIRLHASALRVLAKLDPDACQYYQTHFDCHHFSGNRFHIDRHHRIAEALVMCLRADIASWPHKLPDPNNIDVRRNEISGSMFYLSLALKDFWEGEMNKTKFSRMVGAIIYPGGSYMVYNSRDTLMKWSGNGESKVQSYLSVALAMSTAAGQINSAILFGEDHLVALRTLEEAQRRRRYDLRFDNVYRHIHFIPLNEFGIKQLKTIVMKDWYDQHMEILYGEDAGYHGGCYFEYDAVIDGVCHVSMLEGNLCKLIRVKDSLKTDSKSVYDIVCYPEQLDMIQEYLIEFHGKNRISLRTVTIEQVHDCLFEE
ncbi:MAG: hypothetical protein IIU86_02950 [Oscillospiraceae bacterium]|nr:hypothetical protein [Oscillospiraceae bacterium]